MHKPDFIGASFLFALNESIYTVRWYRTGDQWSYVVTDDHGITSKHPTTLEPTPANAATILEMFLDHFPPTGAIII